MTPPAAETGPADIGESSKIEYVRRALASDPLPRIVSEQYFAKPMHAVFRMAELSAYRAARFKITGPAFDVGCGKGEFGVVFCRSMGLERLQLGVEPNGAYLRDAEKSSVYENVSRASATEIPVRDRAAGFIICNGVLCCIEPGADAAVRELARVLAPGGVVAITLPTPAFAHGLLPTRMLRRLNLNTLAELYLRRTNSRHGHRKVEAPEFWCDLLEASGLHVEKIVPFFTGRVALWWSVLAMRPFQAFALLRLAPAPVRRLAIACTERAVRAVAAQSGQSAQQPGYLLIVAKQPGGRARDVVAMSSGSSSGGDTAAADVGRGDS